MTGANSNFLKKETSALVFRLSLCRSLRELYLGGLCLFGFRDGEQEDPAAPLGAPTSEVDGPRARPHDEDNKTG